MDREVRAKTGRGKAIWAGLSTLQRSIAKAVLEDLRIPSKPSPARIGKAVGESEPVVRKALTAAYAKQLRFPAQKGRGTKFPKFVKWCELNLELYERQTGPGAPREEPSEEDLQALAARLTLNDGALREYSPVICEFSKWGSDAPDARLVGLWNPDEDVMVRLPNSLSLQSPYDEDEHSHKLSKNGPLYPSSQIGERWKQLESVAGKLWRPIKAHVIQTFIETMKDERRLCYVSAIELPQRYELVCPAYDQHFENEHRRFKALVSALSVKDLAHTAWSHSASDDELRAYVGDVLVDNASVAKASRLPTESGVDQEAIFLALTGLIAMAKAEETIVLAKDELL